MKLHVQYGMLCCVFVDVMLSYGITVLSSVMSIVKGNEMKCKIM